MPFAILAALALVTASPAPTYDEAVECAVVYSLAGNLDSPSRYAQGPTRLGRIGVEWQVYAVEKRPAKSDTLVDLAQRTRRIVRTMLTAGGVKGWGRALKPATAQCEELQAGLPNGARKTIEEIQAAIKEIPAKKR